jgi:uncharacterized protein
MLGYRFPGYLPSAEDLLDSDKTPVDNELQELIPVENLRKYGIDFVDVPSVSDGNTVMLEDARYNYGERRFVSFSLLAGRIVAIVHTEDDGLIRIISARKASKYEQQVYVEQV